MEENIKVIGLMENNMEKENFCRIKKLFGGKEFGMKGKEYAGPMNQRIPLFRFYIKLNYFVG
jgi:hypothetical protein